MSAQQTVPDGEGEQPAHPDGRRFLTRRRFLINAAGGLASLGLAGLAGYEWPHTAEKSTTSQPDDPAISGVQGFITRPDLRPPTVRVTRHFPDGNPASEPSASRYILLAERHLSPAPSQPGLMLLDRQGRLIWFKPITSESPFDFNAESYKGQPHLTWWQGEVTSGYGVGVGKMANSSYRTVETIHAGGGLMADLHELNLTSAGTALITAYEQTTADLSTRGGSRHGKMLVGHAQEIDLATGKVLFDWDSAHHVGIAESYVSPSADGSVPYDYFHINAISETPDGNLLISARNTWAVYKIDRTNGKIIWRMNGKRSDFTMGPNTHFYWQHDARMPAPTVLTLFDDGSSPPEESRSRALLLSVDTKSMAVSLQHAYVHPAGFIAANQGSTQLLADGRVFVGWGNQPYFSEFAPDGTLLLDGELPLGIRSYRAFLQDWVGHPSESPSIVARTNSAGGSIVYVSWNGATEIASWTVLAGSDPSSLRAVGSQEWTGFETAIAINSVGPHYSAMALDSHGNELGRSSVVERSDG